MDNIPICEPPPAPPHLPIDIKAEIMMITNLWLNGFVSWPNITLVKFYGNIRIATQELNTTIHNLLSRSMLTSCCA